MIYYNILSDKLEQEWPSQPFMWFQSNIIIPLWCSCSGAVLKREGREVQCDLWCVERLQHVIRTSGPGRHVAPMTWKHNRSKNSTDKLNFFQRVRKVIFLNTALNCRPHWAEGEGIRPTQNSHSWDFQQECPDTARNFLNLIFLPSIVSKVISFFPFWNIIRSEFVMYCWPVQTSSRKCKMINDMFNQISKFHLAQLLDWKIHFGSLLTIMVGKPSPGYILPCSILVRNISLLVRMLMRLHCQHWQSGLSPLVMRGQPQPGYNYSWYDMIVWRAPTPGLPAMQIQQSQR